MRLRQQIRCIIGLDIDEKAVHDRIGKGIANPDTPDNYTYSLAYTMRQLELNPLDYLVKKYGKDEAEEIMDSIDTSIELNIDDENIVNILYVVCVWREEAKQTINAVDNVSSKTVANASKVIDQFVLTCIRYWTLEPIFDQSCVAGVGRRTVGTILTFLERHGIIKKLKQSNRAGESNIYKLAGTEHSPDEVRAAFDRLKLTSVTPAAQVEEFIEQLEPVKVSYEDKKEHFDDWFAAGKPGTLEEYTAGKRKPEYNW